jgi:glycosyltransferase involved in cell wall biosynthesis
VPTYNNITILCSYLNAFGGYEKIVAYTANLFAEKGKQVTLVILAETAESFFTLHEKVRIIQLPLNFGITPKGNMITRKIKMLGDLKKLRRTLKKLDPSMVIATEYPYVIASVICNPGKETKIVCWEHSHFKANIKNKFWTKLFRLTYPKLDKIVCQNQDEKKLLLPVNDKVTVIPYFVNSSVPAASLQNKTILTVARLAPIKGITHLLQTAKMILHSYPGWQWKIIGEGELKKEVTDFIEKEDLQNKLILQPPVDQDIHSEYQNASLLVMTSLNECFPMVLLEALSNRLPCIAFDCDTGPRHIITHNDDGLLVEKENPVKLAEAITSLIEDEELRKKMGANAFKNIQRFSPEIVYQLWEKEVFTL